MMLFLALLLLISVHVVITQKELKVDVTADNNKLSCWAFHTLAAGGHDLVLTKVKDKKAVTENRKRSSCGVSKAELMIPGVPFDGMKTCASNVEGFQCDEFPPAASEEAGTMDPREMSSMCMPGASNMAAGGMLSHIDDGATFKYVLSSTDAAVLFQLCWDYMIFSKLLPSSARPSSLPAYKERTTKSGRVSRSYAGLGSLRAEAAGWAHEFVNELRGDGFNAEELAAEEAVGRSRVAAPMARKMTTVAKGASGKKAAPAMSASNAAKSADGVKGQGKPVDLKAFLSKMSARFGKLRAKVQAITAKISARMKNAAKAVGDGFKKMIGAAKGAVRKGVPAAKGKV